MSKRDFEPVDAWMICTADGEIYIARKKSEAIAAATFEWGRSWDYLKRQFGWRCVPVTIAPREDV